MLCAWQPLQPPARPLQTARMKGRARLWPPPDRRAHPPQVPEPSQVPVPSSQLVPSGA